MLQGPQWYTYHQLCSAPHILAIARQARGSIDEFHDGICPPNIGQARRRADSEGNG